MSKTVATSASESSAVGASLFGGDASSVITQLPLKELDVVDAIPINTQQLPISSVGESPTYRNKAHPQLVANLHPELDTYYRIFNNAATLFHNRPCFGSLTGTGGSWSYAEVAEKKRFLGSGLLKLLTTNPFLDPDSSHAKILQHEHTYAKHTHSDISFIVSIFSANRAEWMLTDLACAAYAITSTALYDTLGDSVTLHILASTESPVVVCSRDKLEPLLRLKSQNKLPALIALVSMDPLDDDALISTAHNLGIVLTDLDTVIIQGQAHLRNELPPSPTSLYTISFTSGTTGANPKGAKITHANMAAAIAFLSSEIPQVAHGRALIFLPLTHIFERGTSAFAISCGYYLGFPSTLTPGTKPDAFAHLIENCRIFKPHYFSIVPRLLTKLESVIKSHIANSEPINAQILSKIIDYKLSKQSAYDGATGFNSIIDHYPGYTQLRKMLGFDNLVWTQTASAPINPATLKYLKASLNIGVSQMYGLTESTGAYTRSHPYESHPGSCGSTGIACEVKLASRDEMGYTVDNHQGELMIRGPQIFPGYYKSEQETAKVLDSETGWFSSGDIAEIDPVTGRIFIIDRVKNFFKLAQGEYISPEKVENVYLSKNPIIQQLYVHGDSIRHWLVGVVGVSYESGLQFLNDECGYNRADMSESEVLMELNKLSNKTRFLEQINHAVAGNLNGLEKLHNIHIEINPLRLDRDVVTPTFKIKRAIAAKFFAQPFHRLYELEQSLLDKAKL